MPRDYLLLVSIKKDLLIEGLKIIVIADIDLKLNFI